MNGVSAETISEVSAHNQVGDQSDNITSERQP
jgi:hypothetical protein